MRLMCLIVSKQAQFAEQCLLDCILLSLLHSHMTIGDCFVFAKADITSGK